MRDEPTAFGADYQEELTADSARLAVDPPGVMLGGFIGGMLVGSAGLAVSSKIKLRHKGHIFGVYVTPAGRGTGVAGGLMRGLIAHARAGGLSVLQLSVTLGNEAATRLYLSAGFTVYGLERRALLVDGQYVDGELMVLMLDPSVSVIAT